MDIQDIKQLYAKAPGTVALCKLLQENRGSNIFLQGQQASATPLLFAAVATEIKQTFLFVLHKYLFSFFLMPTKLAIFIMTLHR